MIALLSRGQLSPFVSLLSCLSRLAELWSGVLALQNGLQGERVYAQGDQKLCSCCPAGLACMQANAVATFNVLNQEGRKVVGALLPQGTVEGGADGGGSGDDS